MTAAHFGLDCVYIAASANDARYTRICVASIRYFYPDAVVKVLPGGLLETGLREELARYWDVGIAPLKSGDWGWGFVKLEPLFGSVGENFLILDSDTAVIGDVISVWRSNAADFLVDDERQTESDTHRLYYDWRRVAAIDARARPPRFVFNSGQWFGTAGILSRQDFARFIDWHDMPAQLRQPDVFMPGEQGVLNFVVNQKVALEGLAVNRCKIMLWPGHGMNGIDRAQVAERRAPPLIVHWAGLKKPKLSDMVGGDVLVFFEELYYKRLPRPRLQRLNGIARHASRELRTRLQIRGRMIRRKVPFVW